MEHGGYDDAFRLYADHRQTKFSQRTKMLVGMATRRRMLVECEIEVVSASKLLANASNSRQLVHTERLFETRIHRRYLVEITF